MSIIGFTKKGLDEYLSYEESPNEVVEGIELLRAVENDMSVYSVLLNGESFSVDIYDDLVRARGAMTNDETYQKYKKS